MKRIQATTALLLLLTFMISGCSKSTPNPGAIVVILIDMTTSARADANAYMQSVTKVLNAAGNGDKLYVVPITGSLTPQIAATATFPAPSSNPVTDAKKLKETRLKFQADVAALLKSDRPVAPGTAILSGLQKAGAIFKAEGAGRPRTLVILSDMIEQGRLDFTAANLTPPGPVLDQLAQDGLLPQLDANVYVAGIATGQAQTYSVPAERFQAITQFWAAYFARAGANLGPYDRDLLNFQIKR